MIVICGVVVTIVAAIGTCGALTGSMCKLITYAVLLILLFVVQTAIVAYLMIVTNYESEDHESDFKKMVYRRFLLILIKYNRSAFAQEWIDIMQQHFQCCGIGHPCDWVILTNSTEVPDTCCTLGSPYCNQSNAFQRGCLLPIFDTIRENSDFFSGWLAFISMFEVCIF
ncbi:hypothetical protein ILUMI_17092 [Ignelater luminosus]|uniref:Tetraspanin n=1 Tax=Ignelater luminosus TaxID=2038154 RepID=A0A8K0G7W2_IGNLU|nr:hypothetical protein ILUMI_17092 [Ignelater luminosus]